MTIAAGAFQAKSLTSYLTGGDGKLAQGKLVGTTPGGAYEIIVNLFFPSGGFLTSNKAMVELQNETLHKQFGSLKFKLDAMRGLLATGGGLLGSDKYMVEDNGHVMVTASVSPYVHNLEAALGVVSPVFPFLPGAQPAFDAGIGITGPSQANIDVIIADLSEFARNPSAFWADAGAGADPGVPTSTHVIAAGYSDSAFYWRDWLSRGRNSALGGPAAFPNNLVYEGTLLGGCGSRTAFYNSSAPFYGGYGFYPNETPGAEGDVLQVDTEFAISGLEGFNARLTGALAHYGHVELRGMSHLPQDFIPVGVQNTASLNPYMRSAWEALLAKVVSATPFGAGYDSAAYGIDGSQVIRGGGPLMPDPYPNSFHPAPVLTTANMWQPVIGPDNNWESPLPMPHVRSLSASGGQIGAPIGYHRAWNCFAWPGFEVNEEQDAIVDCPLLPPLGGAEQSIALGGHYRRPSLRQRDRDYKDLASMLGLFESAVDEMIALGVLRAAEKAELIAEATARYNGVV